MDKTKALQKLLNGTATKKEIESLKQALASGEISIGGEVNRSVVIIGSGNKVELTSEALNLLTSKPAGAEPAAGEPPYMGLRYFDTSDADLFFGRAHLTRDLLARVQKETFLAIVGASGSGKSSVARAGLIPAWKQENERGAVHVIVPSAHPLESLAASLTRGSESVTATSTLMDDLAKDARSLRLYVRRSAGACLLVVDQFEETFTLCKDPAERKAFIENLLGLAEKDGAARVVLTLRADFYHHCAEYEGLRLALEKHQAYIGAMTRDELCEAITTPAETNGWDFQPGLVDLILQDVGAEPGALPLLSHALLETWKRRQGRTLTLQGYHEAGGVRKAITQTAESVYDQLTPAEQGIARGIFLRLTELGEGAQDTRRRVKLEELSHSQEQDAVSKVLKTLTDARLVTAEEDSAEVAHEALIREWGTLRKWLDEDRESLRTHRHLTESAMEWQRRKREASELYRGARLKQLLDWAKEHADALSPLEREFVKASESVKKREQLQWLGVAVMSVVLLLMVVLGVTGQLNRFIYRPVDMEDYWVTIPAGEFQMGSESGEDDEKTVHKVYLDEFQIGKYEVTNRQMAQCGRASVCIGRSNIGDDMDLHPVSSITWHDAQNYCAWVGGRLPTEAEWEKAARGGLISKKYPWGDKAPTCTKSIQNGANYFGVECSFSTMPVGSFYPNSYGLYDMSGNVSEWVNDWYSDIYYSQSVYFNPTGPKNGEYRVHRGGSLASSYENDLRTFARSAENPNLIMFYLGFRCARSPK